MSGRSHDACLLKAVQSEVQKELGGHLTSLCVWGLTMLQPLQTMTSYVVGISADCACSDVLRERVPVMQELQVHPTRFVCLFKEAQS